MSEYQKCLVFDGPRSDYMKERGMKIAESNAETALNLARDIAKELARHKPFVNTDEYKISNDFIALYARLFMFEYQDYKGFFRTRPMKRVSIKGE